MDCNLIVLLFSPVRLARAARIANLVISRAKPGRTLLVINGNAIDSLTARNAIRGPRIEVIEHDNTGQEFGGYQAAIDHLGGDIPGQLVIMNDTAGSHDILTSSYVSMFLAQLAYSPGATGIGKIDMSHLRQELCGRHASRWLRTHFFGLNRAAMHALGNRIYHPEIDRLITASPDIETFYGSGVTGSLRQHIHDYLFSPSPYSWHSAAPLSESNCHAMAGKVRAVLQEKYLSMLIEDSGIAMRPVYFGSRELYMHHAQTAFRTLLHLLGSRS